MISTAAARIGAAGLFARGVGVAWLERRNAAAVDSLNMNTIAILSLVAVALSALVAVTWSHVCPPRNTRGGRLGKFLTLSGAVRRI